MRRARWLGVGLGLFVAAVFLFRSGARDDLSHEARPRPTFPSAPTPKERARNAERRTLRRVPALAAEADEPAAPDPLDPVGVALGALTGPDRPDVLVVEASAVRHSPVGEMMLDCMSAEARTRLGEVSEDLGFDPIERMDRIAVADGGVLVSGQFDGVAARMIERGELTAYGDHGHLDEMDSGRMAVLWNDEMFATVDDRAAAERLIDRLEGRAASPPYDLEDMAYGEAYGRFGPERIAELVPDEQSGLREQFLRTVEGLELHLDAQGDPAISMRANGEDAAGMDELALVLGGAFALGRTAAQVEGDEELAALLEHARVTGRSGGAFTLEFSLPLDVVRDELLKCKPSVEETAPAAPGLDAGAP